MKIIVKNNLLTVSTACIVKEIETRLAEEMKVIHKDLEPEVVMGIVHQMFEEECSISNYMESIEIDFLLGLYILEYSSIDKIKEFENAFQINYMKEYLFENYGDLIQTIQEN